MCVCVCVCVCDEFVEQMVRDWRCLGSVPGAAGLFLEVDMQLVVVHL